MLSYSRAGHNRPLWIHEGICEELDSPGTAIGLDSGKRFDQILEGRTVSLKPGHLVLLYTDGLLKGKNEQGAEFGLERLRSSIRTSARPGARGLLVHLLHTFDYFRGKTIPEDDLTIVAFRRIQ